ncbi:hypothetical protein HFO17_08600 [Rhizobium laguerreae]|nr:hypothetical protein [Rhizobium laguerreae]MBY3234598.1 hypothetical protein [Rhizobium laguerreae]
MRYLLPHEAGERVDLLLRHAQLGERSLQRGLRVTALVLQRSEAAL